MTVEKLIPILTSNLNGIKYIDEISNFGTLKGSNDESNKLFWHKKNIRTKDILNNPTIDNKNSLNYIDAVYEESTKILTFKYTIKYFPLKLFTQKINLENNSFNSSTTVTEFKEIDKVKQTTETNYNSEENPKKTDEISISDENKALRILTWEDDGFSVWGTGAMFSIEFKIIF
ncbi:Uncharacterised protein [Mycoplasmopsis maculosa]|uniref:Uncharacterized protein n=1 Tax=Mycoplasmopsis maculosa TaxID=114885 RepID=A0A449B5C7_9BACT|nr:hypothetical protein [Mycoplasmopsis maculosa]VEU75807.1 Uncharacterised protein [Mycoplasmopsis maculosa]